jgi:hypothetical protein
MNIIVETVDRFFNKVFDFRSRTRYNSGSFNELFNNIKFIGETYNNTLKETFDLRPYFNLTETIIHYLLYFIIFIPLQNEFDDFVYFNNRTDIQENVSFKTNIVELANLSKNPKKNLYNLIYNQYDYTSQLTYFIFKLLIEIDNNILLLNNQVTNKNSLEVLIYYKNTFYKRGLNKDSELLFNTLKLLLIYGKNIVIIQQSFIRRFLSKRKLIKLKKEKCLEIILYSLPKQIEFTKYKSFTGGYKYKLLKNRFDKLKLI